MCLNISKSFSFSLGVSILELACNIEVPNGGEGWQQLRQGCLPSEFTNGKIHFLLSPHKLSHYLFIQMTSNEISICIRRSVNWTSDSTADDAGPRTIWKTDSPWAPCPPLCLETQVEKAHLSYGGRDHADTGLPLSGDVSNNPLKHLFLEFGFKLLNVLNM